MRKEENSMTANQINYQNLQENIRHNVTTEFEAVRHNVTGERETTRHNIVGEVELNRHNVVWEQETGRHNVVTERETGRHNRATESVAQGQLALGYSQLAEAIQHNRSTEALTNDRNLNDLNLGKFANIIKQQQADAATSTAATRRTEAEIRAKEATTHRINAIWGGINDSLSVLSKGAGAVGQLLPFLIK